MPHAAPRRATCWALLAPLPPFLPRSAANPDGADRRVYDDFLVELTAHRPAAVKTYLDRYYNLDLDSYGTTPDGRLFRGIRGGMLSESLYGRTWHAARTAALGPALASTGLARRPYDLRHAALSLWLNASSAPAEIAARAGTSVHILQTVYTHCTHGQEDVASRQIEHALRIASPSLLVTASGSPDRRHRPEPVRYRRIGSAFFIARAAE